MLTTDVCALLAVWERGVRGSPTVRAVLLLGAAVPDADDAALLQAPIGQRDAWLLRLREALFGSRFECLLPCPACAQRIEIAFQADDIRAPHAAADCVCVVDGGLQYRVPTSADLLALEGETDLAVAERRLLQRCRLTQAGDAMSDVMFAAMDDAMDDAMADLMDGGLDDATPARVSAALSEADPQAEVLLDLCCPACGAAARRPFDIAAHLWSELDHWARAMLHKVHLLASRYGWSEHDILALSPARRQAYLQHLGVA